MVEWMVLKTIIRLSKRLLRLLQRSSIKSEDPFVAYAPRHAPSFSLSHFLPPSPKLSGPLTLLSAFHTLLAKSPLFLILTSKGAAYYISAPSLSVTHYQSLVDRGWRRSGSTLYLPDPVRSCCPHYTIRLPAPEFHPSKSQRQAVNRWNRHILGPNHEKYKAEAAKR